MNTTLPTILEESLEIKQMKFDLERMRRFDALLGYPSRQFPSVHVGGTNGKGSVATKIASAFPTKKVGLFTSPHISSYRERIQINRNWISEEIGEELLTFIIKVLPQRPTYFELLTLLAFFYFAKEKVDLAVIEVGMGGRLDATNIITPLLSVITSIDLEHTQYLGTTLEEIAREKGGIIKAGVPLVVGPRAHYYPDHDLLYHVAGNFTDYEEENQAIARQALMLLGVENPDLSAVPPCRFERWGNVIFDVAHNPAGLVRTFERCAVTFPRKKIRALVAFSADKDITTCLDVVRRHTVAHHLVKIDHPRVDVPENALSIEEALRLAQADELILITGTFFMMADAQATVKRVLALD